MNQDYINSRKVLLPKNKELPFVTHNELPKLSEQKSKQTASYLYAAFSFLTAALTMEKGKNSRHLVKYRVQEYRFRKIQTKKDSK